MTSTDWTDWLGPAAADLTPDQRERFGVEAEAIIGRYPSDAAECDAALSATVQYLLGETTITEAGEALMTTRTRTSEALATAQQIARLAVQDGLSEVKAAERAGLDRMTVRKALGKR